MKSYTISRDSSAEDLAPIAMCLHELLNRLPTTARSLHHNGIRIEEGHVVDRDYTGPVLEDVLHSGNITKTIPASGPYRGVPVIVAPIRDNEGEVIGVIGVVDITGIFDLATLMEHQSMILKQVCGKDPCPLPQELTGGRR
ncbi:MAG: DUF2111 domain-containing protein [Methanomicrobiales archaeon]|nr:DUF2111 domain-containing protein [Methanomicrobiales archaeon]